MPRWFEADRRLEQELVALEERGIQYTIDEEAKCQGVIRLELSLPEGGPWGRALALTATYPPEYPYFRPFVVAKDLSLSRHQHPFSGNLCLLGRDTLHWDVAQTLAEHLVEQLPKLFEAAERDVSALMEDPHEQAEPFSDYYDYPPGAIVLVDSRVETPGDAMTGTMVLRASKSPHPFLRAALMTVADASGKAISEGDPGLAAPLGETDKLQGRWVRVDKPLCHKTAADALEALRREHSELIPLRSARATRKRGKRKATRLRLAPEILGVVFPEERAPGEFGDSWLFIVRDQQASRSVYYARVMRADSGSVLERAPELMPLRQVTIGLVGLGCVGAPIALDLLRAGVGTLRVLDPDHVDAATTVRWPVGLTAAGFPKVWVIQQIALRDYPYSKVEMCARRIGAPELDSPEAAANGFLPIDEFLDRLDLIVDASAEFSVQHYLADHARKAGIPFIHASGTHGGWGGLVFRVRPESGAPCWYCVRHAIEAGELPLGAEDEDGTLQPAGCADPTFTGAGFDLTHASLQAVRMAVATLCGPAGGYPEFAVDYSALSLRTKEGEPTPARWVSSSVPKDPSCPRCGE